jgi:hypothetical protein
MPYHAPYKLATGTNVETLHLCQKQLFLGPTSQSFSTTYVACSIHSLTSKKGILNVVGTAVPGKTKKYWSKSYEIHTDCVSYRLRMTYCMMCMYRYAIMVLETT